MKVKKMNGEEGMKMKKIKSKVVYFLVFDSFILLHLLSLFLISFFPFFLFGFLCFFLSIYCAGSPSFSCFSFEGPSGCLKNKSEKVRKEERKRKRKRKETNLMK